NTQQVRRDDWLDHSRIAWERLAEPQDDQYDSLLTLEFARRRGYVRRDTGHDPTLFDGAVAIRPDDALLSPGCVPASCDHPNLQRACDLVRLWPTVFRQCQLLIESVSVFVDTYHSWTSGGSICGSGTRGFGTIASTVNSDIGFAEAIVH